MRRLSLILLFSLWCVVTSAQQRWALVVGISDYPEESGWSSISGANDIDLIVPMLERSGFDRNQITTLSNAEATKQGITAAFNRLGGRVRRGDVVYVHFSCHGQLVTDLNGDEQGYGWDEALVPYDAMIDNRGGYNAERHIVDDELNIWLTLLKQRIGAAGRLVVVVDACYSGGVSRGEGEKREVMRGARKKFDIVEQPAAKPLPAFPLEIDWLCISACQSFQANQEHRTAEGIYYGRLSYVLERVFSPEHTPDELQRLVDEQYRALPSRRPQQADFDVAESLVGQNIM